MAIKKMNADMFDKVISKEPIDNNELSIQETELLVSKALKELTSIIDVINMTTMLIDSSCFGEALLTTNEFIEYKEAMEHYLSFVIPNLLAGDIDSIIKEAGNYDNEEEFRNNLEKLRLNFFENLAKKYL